MTKDIAKTETTAVAKSEHKTIKDWLVSDEFKRQIAMALPKHLTPDRFIRVALTAMMRTPKLAQCTQASLFKCLLDLSQLGIEPDGRRAYLIPRGNSNAKTIECTYIVDYKGLVELVMRSGLVSNIHADIVCDNDEFEYNIGEIVKHKIDFKKDRGKAYAAYAIVTLKDGTKKCEVLAADEIEKIRKQSPNGNTGPWIAYPYEMWKKTAFRRCHKWLSLSPETQRLIEMDDCQYDTLTIPAEPITSSLDELADKLESETATEITGEELPL